MAEQKNNTTPELWPAYGTILADDLPNPISVEDLQKQEMFSTIQQVAEEIVRTDYSPDAQELLKRLQILESLRVVDAALFEKYQALVSTLKFVTLQGRKEQEIIALMRSGLLPALEAGVNVKARLALTFLVYDELIGEGILPRKLVNAMNANEELIGGQKVKDWISDYARFINATTRPGSRMRPGGVDRIGYITRGEKARRLAAADRKIILDILEVHDWLVYGPASYEELNPTLIALKPSLPKKLPPLSAVRPPSPPPSPPRPTIAPVELRDRSTPGLAAKPQEPEFPISNFQFPNKSQIPIQKTKTQPGSSLPPTAYSLPADVLPPAPLHRTKKLSPLPTPPPPGEGIAKNKFLPLEGPLRRSEGEARGGKEGVSLPRQSLNEALYKSSLEELTKIRKQFEEARKPQITNNKLQTNPKSQIQIPKPPANPAPHLPLGVTFSVNEELINAGSKVQNTDHGVITPQTPAAPPPKPEAAKPEPERPDKDIEEKLHKLEERIE